MLKLLEHKHAGALTHHKAATARVEWHRSAGGVIACMQGAHGGEAADGKRGDGGFGTTYQHDLGVTVADVAECIAYRVRTACAGRDRAGAHPLEAKLDSNLASGHVEMPMGI